MNGIFFLLWLVSTPMPVIQVATLAGEQHQGALEAFSPEAIVVKTDSKSVTIPVSEVLLIRSTQSTAVSPNDSRYEMRLVDMTRLRVQSVVSSGTISTVVHSRLGELKIPTANISSIRFSPSEPKMDAEWNQLLDRAIKKDVVAIRKGDVLDHLDGVIGSLNEATMQFQMDSDEIAIKREKVFGLIYSKRVSLAKKAIAQLELVTGDQLALKQIQWNGTAWTAILVTGLEVEVPPDLFFTLDYSLGKVAFLSDMQPRTAKHTPFWDPQINLPGSYVVNEYRRDKNFDGTPISLGETTYAKGLAIHSQSLLKYRLGGDYRRFQAVMGIGDEVPSGDVDVTLKGDNKILFKGAVKANEPATKGSLRRAAPQHLDIDVTGVVELEIFVDYGSDKRDIGDRLYLANARAVK